MLQGAARGAVQPTSPTGFPTPGLTADALVVRDGQVLLVQRGKEPFKGSWALPGGFVEVGETTVHACMRELREECGIVGEVVDLLGVYDDPDRDPRGHIVTVAYVVKAAEGAEPRAGDDAAGVRWFDLDALPKDLAADHGEILEDLLEWLDAGGEDLLAADDGDL